MILEGIAKLEAREGRLLLNRAKVLVDEIAAGLLDVLDVGRIVPAGSYRRRKETIGDLDLLAETDEPKRVIKTFVELPSVEAVLNQGGHKAAVRLGGRGPQVDLMVMRPGEAGTYLIHFTGSKEHNVRLRAMARDKGWSLSEYGFARLGEDGEIITDVAKGGELRTFATEAEAYAFLGLPFIEPELREDTGEIEAALAGTLPTLVTEADLQGDLHSHSDWSDGAMPVEQMAEFARRRGHAYQVMTDHSQSLAIAKGLTPERVALERTLIRGLNARFAAEEADGQRASRDERRGLPAAPRLRARDPRRRPARLSGQAARDVRPRGRLAPRRPPAIARRADTAGPERDREPPCRRHRAPIGADDRDARRPRSRLGDRLQARRPAPGPCWR